MENKIVYMGGDDTAGLVADLVLEKLFSQFDFVHCPMNVDARMSTNDGCIQTAVEALKEYGSGVKISTASNDQQIVEAGLKSANIALRDEIGCVGMFRLTFGPGKYKKPIAILRCGTGDFYDEKSCEIEEKDGHEIAVITQHMNLDYVRKFAQIALDRAREHGFQIILSTKWTISPGEKLIYDICNKIFAENGLTKGKRGEGAYYTELTDIAGANIPINIELPDMNSPMSVNNGGWLLVTGNAAGDTASDIADLQHDGNSMGSEVICNDGFSYFELPGGTAPDKNNTDLKGKGNFFSPVGIIVSFYGAITQVNPDAKEYCDSVLHCALQYMNETPEANRCTNTMIDWIANQVSVTA